MEFLSKEAILNVVDLPIEEVDIKEWNGKILMRGLTAAERDDFEANVFLGEGKNRKFNHANLRARLLALCIVDNKGERLFTDSDITQLGKKSGKILDRLFGVAQRLSGIGQTDIDDLLKNFDPGQQD